MRGKTVLLAAAFAALIATPAFAQTTCKLQQLAELPVRMLGFRPVITARVNGIDGQFLVDTGAYDSVISKASAERFGLHATPAPIRLTLRGVGGEERDVGFAQAKDFGFATADIHNVIFMVTGHAPGGGLDGNIGLGMLGFADVEFDLAHNVIRLFKPQGCGGGAATAYWADPNQLNWLDIAPIDSKSQKIRADAAIDGRPIKVTFDTGASRSGLKRETAEKLGFKIDGPGVRPGGRIHGFGPRTAESWIAPFSEFSMGGEDIHNTQIRVFDRSMGANHDLTLGADFFMAHRIYVSAAQKRLFFTYNGGPVFRVDKAPASETEPDAASAAAP